MSTPDLDHPEQIRGYTYGTDQASASPLSMEDLEHPKTSLQPTSVKKNTTDDADSLDHIPMRYLLAFTAVVITSARGYLTARGHTPDDVDRMHAAFTKSVMLHLTVWTRAYNPPGW